VKVDQPGRACLVRTLERVEGRAHVAECRVNHREILGADVLLFRFCFEARHDLFRFLAPVESSERTHDDGVLAHRSEAP
jgi:hypothetical protein